MSAPGQSVWERVQGAELIVVCGAGGVGKTTVSASVGLALAREGRRVLVLTVDPAKRLAEALGTGLGPDPVAVSLPDHPSMDAAMLDAAASFRRVVASLPVRESDRQRLLASRITRELAGGVAGMQELMGVVELERFSSGGDYDVIVLDTPPSLHALEMLDGPERIVGLLSGRTVRTVGRASGLAGRFGKLPGPGRALGKLWGADLLTEIATFLDAAAPFGRALGSHLEHAESLLHSERAAFLLVAAPWQEPIEIVGELADELRRRRYPVAGTVVNRRRVPLDAPSPETFAAMAEQLRGAGHDRSAVLAEHVRAVIEHEAELLGAARLPQPTATLGERPPQESPEAVLSGLAGELAGR